MVIKLNLNSSTWVRSQAETVKDRLVKAQKEIAHALGYDICLSLVLNESRNVAVVKSKYIRDESLLESIIPNSVFVNRHIHMAIKDMINTKDIVEVHEDGEYPLLLKGMKSEVYIPIFEPIDTQGNSLKLIGCLYLGSSIHKDLPKDIFHELIDSQISYISKLYTLVLDGTRDIIKAINMISVFADILEQKEKYLPNHGYNVANWCREIGIKIGYNHEQLTRLTYAGLLHDIGKSLSDYNILNKPEKLTEEEYATIKEHPLVGHRIASSILQNIPLLQDIPKIIKHHHERYDGKGYPSGLKKDEVPFDSYVIGIADAVDAMMSDRPYKRAMTLKDVIQELYRNKGKQFHPELVDVMVDRLTKAQNQLEVNLIQDVELSSIIINLNEKLLILEGTLIHSDSYFIFKPHDEEKAEGINLADITDAEIAIRDLNNINYYQTKVEDLLDNEFYISSIKLIPSANTFSLLWNLDGILYDPEDNGEIPVEITKVGGDSLSFYVDSSYNLINKIIDSIFNKTIRVKILFDDFDIDITGNIVKSHNFGPYKYFDLHYTNIPDSKRDSIYRQLFKKQIELRRTISQFK